MTSSPGEMFETVLLTPGSLTTSLATREAMLRDFGSPDGVFIDLTQEMRRRLLSVANGLDSHVAVPSPGSGAFIVEAAIATLTGPGDKHRRDRAGRFPAAADRNPGGGRRDEARAAAGTSRIFAMTAVPARDIAVVLLAAGVGRRLGDATPGPKVLLEFSGQTLLERHLRTLMSYGIEDIGLTVGYQSDAIGQEVARLGLEDRVRLIPNPDFRKGSLVSLSVQGDRLRGGRPVMLMDGDVLYDPAMIGRLLAAPGENILLMDRDIEPGDEPVKICLSGERIVDFRKKPEHAHDRHGESVGFFRFSAATAAALAERCGQHVAEGRSDLEYEEAIRDLILAEPERFAVADIGDIPWIEIDFGDDVTRARETIMPRLEPCP